MKKSKLKNLSKLFISILYGYFVVINVGFDYASESGDIGALIFNAIVKINDPNFSAEFLFWYSINLLNVNFNIDYLTIFKFISFTISAIIFLIFSINVRSETHSNYLWPLFFLVFLSPVVFDLFASGVRSGIAFVLFFYAIIYLSGISKYILFVISVYFHLSMLPIIGLYFLFNFIDKNRLKFSIPIYYIILFTYGIFIVFLANQFVNLPDVSQSIRYQVLIFILSLYFCFISKKTIKDIYGFMSIGTIFIVLFGFVFDLSFIRFVGNAILLYFFYLIKKNKKRTIQVFFLCYLPFFTLIALYSIPGIIR